MQPVAFLFDGVFAYTQQGRNSSHCLLPEEVLHQIVKFVARCRKFIVRERSSECCQVRDEARILMRGYLILL